MIDRSASEVLGLCDEFLRRRASPTVHAELRRFLTDQGHHPVAGLSAFLDKLGSIAEHADTGLPKENEVKRAAELTRLLARASLLPAGAHTRDVGSYRALEVVAHGEGLYWATADVIDEKGGVGHLEVTVARASAWSPPTLAELQQYSEQYPGTTGAERLQSDGSLVTTSTTRTTDGGIFQRAILARLDGSYVDVRTSNEDSRTGRRTRSAPLLDAEAILSKIIDLRP